MTGSAIWTDPELELISTPQGPVRTKTVTVSEIVPGTYGQIRVTTTENGDYVYLGLDRALFNATELRSAALVLTQLAEALEE